MSDTTISLRLVIDGKDANGTLSLTESNLKNLSSAFKVTQDSAQSHFDKLGGRIIAVNQGMEALSKAISVLSKPVEIAGNFEKYSVQFEVLLGSADAAKKRIADLQEFANKTPFELPEVVKASKLLQTFGGSALATGANLTLVGDMASASGAQFEEIAMWVGRANTAIMSGREWGEAAMRLQELGLMSGQTRQRLEDLTKTKEKGDVVWREFVNSMGGYAGMMDKQSKTLGGVLSTMHDSFNLILADIGNAFLPALKEAAKWITNFTDSLKDAPSSIKVLGAALAGLAGAYAMFNSSISVGWYGLIGAIGAFATLYTAIKNGDPAMAAFITIAGSMGLVLIGLQTGFIGSAAGAATFGVSVTTTVIPAIRALAAAFMQLLATPAGAVIVAIAAIATIATATITYFNQVDAEKKKSDKAYSDSTKALVESEKEKWNELSDVQIKNQLGFLTARQISLNSKVGDAQRDVDGKGVAPQSMMNPITRTFSGLFSIFPSGATEEETKRLEDSKRMAAQGAEEIEALEKLLTDRRKQNVTTATKEMADAEAKAKELHIANIADDTERELAELDRKYEEDKKKFGISRKALRELEIKYSNDKQKITDTHEEEEASARAAHDERIAKIQSEADSVFLNIDEKQSLAAATTESERLEITKDFALRRIEAERYAQLEILGIQAIAATYIPEKEKRDAASQEIEDKRAGINSKAGGEIDVVNAGHALDSAAAMKSESQKYESMKFEFAQEGLKKRLDLIQREQDVKRKEINESIADEKKRRDLLIDLDKKTATDTLAAVKEERRVQKKAKEESIAIWREENTVANIAINAMSSGFQQMWQENVMVHRQAKDSGDAIWLAMENSALSAIGNILIKLGEEALASILIKATTTTATVASMTAIEAAALPAALAVNVATMGAAGFIAAGSFVAAAAAQAAGSVLASGAGTSKFATGGLVSGPGGPKDDRVPAMLSNGEFVMNAEAVKHYLPMLQMINERGGMQLPKLAAGGFISIPSMSTQSRLVSDSIRMQINQSSAVDNSAVVAEVRELRKTLMKKNMSVNVGNVVGERELVRRNIADAQRYNAKVTK